MRNTSAALISSAIAIGTALALLVAHHGGHIATRQVPWSVAGAPVQQNHLMALARRYGPGSHIYYQWGGASPRGFDCSGYVWYLYQRVGISLARTSYSQWQRGEHISVGNLRPGDVLFFQGGGYGPRPGHVGLFAYWKHGVAHFYEYYRTGSRSRVSHLRGRYGYWGARRYWHHPKVPRLTYYIHVGMAKHFKTKITGHWKWGVIYRGLHARRVAQIRYARSRGYGVLVRSGYIRIWVQPPLSKYH